MKWIAAIAFFAILSLVIFSGMERGPRKNAIENWLVNSTGQSQAQIMSDGVTRVWVEYYTETSPEGLRPVDANELKYLFNKGLAVTPQVGFVTASKTVADADFTYKSTDKISARFTDGFSVKGGSQLVTVAFLKDGGINTQLVPATLKLWNCRVVLVPKDWKRPIDVHGDRNVATTDNRASSKTGNK